ncbi:hypothetical protein Acr_11g0009660 [Actinidia rufa]|uniref:Transposase (putative) gypsy type domain-containing protein n=1 Tax=Actinidia rufa TaxID=165716 RepID=A0A7J0FD76_9ERIC|nr:hypothetical protein Acr_11g0009660 [Actinidia rufa]
MEINSMTQDDLDHLRESYSFPTGIQTRIPKEGETILSSRLGEVAFYEAVFLAGLRFPIHPTIKRILNFYNICPAQLSPNAWRSVIFMLVIWRFYRRHLSLNEFKSLYTLFRSTRSNSRWLYFKARPGKTHDQGVTQQREMMGKKILLNLWGRRGVLPKNSSKRKSFMGPKFFAPGRVEMSFSGGDNDASGDGVVVASSDEGEFRHPRHKHPRSESPRDGSLEFLGIIKKEWRRILPPLLDLTLLRLLGGKVPDPFRLAMSKRISLTKLAKNVEESKATTSSSKDVGKETIMPPKAKKAKPIKAASREAMQLATPGEGPSKKLSKVLGFETSVMASVAVAKKILTGAIKMKELLVEFSKRERMVVEEMATLRDDREVIIEKLAKMEMVVADQRGREARTKKLGIEEFKSSEDFQEAVEDASSKYFGKGFDFCKRQLAQHHPNLKIDLDDMDMDRDLHERDEAEAEENKDQGEGKGDTNPLSP